MPLFDKLLNDQMSSNRRRALRAQTPAWARVDNWPGHWWHNGRYAATSTEHASSLPPSNSP
jgi:hypothetical protein